MLQSNTTDPNLIRKRMRGLRRSLPPRKQRDHARLATRHALKAPWFRRPKRVGIFISADGELDTRPLMEVLWQRGHRLFLPVLEHGLSRPMLFAEVHPDTPLWPNRYGIAEPVDKRFFPACQLDVVITPLVAFDRHGHLLGMGGGFYDRTFACKLKGHRKPLMIGWAHAFQEVDHLPAQPWDVPLDGAITERGPFSWSAAERADSPDCPAR